MAETVARCEWCHAPFEVRRTWQRFCSSACRLNAHWAAKFKRLEIAKGEKNGKS